MGTRAFTLIELLVVTAIMALLIGILVPALSSSREAGKRIKCLSNVRQMALAANIYTVDGDGSYPIAYFHTTGSPTSYCWDLTTVKSGAKTSIIPGLLWHGQGPLQIQQCPSFNGAANWADNPFTGYNYNTSYIGHGQWEDIVPPAKSSDVTNPSLTVLFGDGQFAGGADKFMRSPFPAPGDINSGDGLRCAGTQGFRHAGRTNAAYCDAHAEVIGRRCTDTSDGSENLGPGTGFLSSDNSAYQP